MRRSQPDNVVPREADNGTVQDESIARRFPRIGAQFQTRISKSTGFTIRPAPERMSVDFPYMSEKEVGELGNGRVNGSTGLKNGAATIDRDFDLKLNYSKSRRGGLLLHKPKKEIVEFSEYVQPFIASTRNKVKPSISNESWIQHMIHLHSTETTGKRSRASRGGVKRKRAENEEMIWNLENILSNLEKNRSKIPGTDILGEEEAVALEHFCLFYGGNIDSAEFNALVNLSAGQASKMRKCEERERTKKRLKVPSQQTSESWREMYESSTLPYVRTILGQLQDDSEPLYLMQTMVDQTADGTLDEHTDVNLVLEPDDSKGAWRSILACAKSIERQLNSEGLGPGDKKPLLSTLLTFVGKAYDLPTPELCFGTHHVMIEEVSNTIISILNHVTKAQNVHAKIRDKLFNESETGINSDDLLKFLESEYNGLPIRLREVDKLYSFRDVIVKWELRLDQVLSVPEEELENTITKNYLRIAEEMQYEARSHGYKSKALVQLTNRINKAYDLRERILRWKCAGTQGKTTTIRTVSGFVKEAKRIKLFSPEVLEILEYHRLAEEWIDRANIAIRSKISLQELKNLIQRGEEMTLDLSEYIDKLKTRVRIADEWLESLDEIVPFQQKECSSLEIWHNLETSLKNGSHSGLHDLSNEGNRIPVNVTAVKLLQLAFDAKNWTTKALKWIPDSPDSKKGKLSDLREHLAKVSSLREKLPLPEMERQRWKPAGECELTAIIVTADSWTEKYAIFLSGDNRKSERRSCLSISKLRTIVDEGNTIYANIGNSISKISRILLQAENWYKSYMPLLQHCGVVSKGDGVANPTKAHVTIQEMSDAVDAARMDVSLDLDEAMALRQILQDSNNWKERVTLIAPKRNKRHSKGSRSKFKFEDLIGLIEEASSLPIDTTESVNRLQIQLNDVEMWRSEASKALEGILFGFTGLKSHVEDVYGNAKDYSIESISGSCDSDQDEAADEEMDTSEDYGSESMEESAQRSEDDVPTSNRGSNSAPAVFRLIRELNEEAKGISVVTLEGEMGEVLDSVSSWCVKSFKYLNTPKEVFDKRYFGAFDRFIVEGESLIGISSNREICPSSSDGLKERLCAAWGSVVKDQLVRLSILKREREKFEAWCESASRILADEKKLTAEKLADLAKSSRHFPANRDLVSKIRGLSVKVSKWTAQVQKLLESGERIDMQDAKVLVERGEKLRVQTDALKRLRAEIRAARNWINRAKECSVDHGSINVHDVKELIHDHDNLLIEMPDELELLKQATIGYCVCRRPYEGFMIGCDHCEEWYHGSCIGISESKADRFEKFVCVRCSTKNLFNTCAVNAAGIIRKWTCPKDLKKARQIEFQKFQRKDRKEKKDIEKFCQQIKDLQDQLSDLKQSELCTGDNDTSMHVELTNSPPIAAGTASSDSKNDVYAVQPDEPSANILLVQNEKSSNNANDGNKVVSRDTSTENIPENKKEVVPDVHEAESMKTDAREIAVCSTTDVSNPSTKEIPSVVSSEADIASKLEKAEASLQLAKERLDKITNQSQQLTVKQEEEDKHSKALRNWCLNVRSEIFLPSVEGQSEIILPSECGSMPSLMEEFISKARHVGIIHLSDVNKMVDCFRGICWSFSAMGILRRKPSLSQVRHLVFEASKFKLPDEKALKTVKFMATKASQLQSKVEKALFTKKTTSKPNMSLLKELQSGVRACPLIVPEEGFLRMVIEDGKLSTRESLESRAEELGQRQSKSQNIREDVSPHAPNPIELWPPFGVHDSQAATQAFGSECLAITNVNHSDADGTSQKSENVIADCSSLPAKNPIHATQRNEVQPKAMDASAESTSKCVDDELEADSSDPKTQGGASVADHELVAFPEGCQNGTVEPVTSGVKSHISNSKSEMQEDETMRTQPPTPSVTPTASMSQAKPEEDEVAPVGPSIPTDESNRGCGSHANSLEKVETKTIDTSVNPTSKSIGVTNSESDTRGSTKIFDTSIATETSINVCGNERDDQPTKKEDSLSPGPTDFTRISNSGLESHAKDDTHDTRKQNPAEMKSQNVPLTLITPNGIPIDKTKEVDRSTANEVSCQEELR